MGPDVNARASNAMGNPNVPHDANDRCFVEYPDVFLAVILFVLDLTPGVFASHATFFLRSEFYFDGSMFANFGAFWGVLGRGPEGRRPPHPPTSPGFSRREMPNPAKRAKSKRRRGEGGWVRESFWPFAQCTRGLRASEVLCESR